MFRNRSRSRRAASYVFIGGLLLSSVFFGEASAAHAAPAGFPSRMSDSGAQRYCIAFSLSGCVSRRTIAAGTYLKMHCWENGSNGERYFWITTQQGKRGFVNSSNIPRSLQTPTPYCPEHVGIAPASWSARRQGERNKTNLIIPTTGGDWSGDCWAFAWNAHATTNGHRGPTGVTAEGARQWYRAQSRLSTNMNQAEMKIGSLVFWSSSALGGVGHVAIYLGNGHVATTIGQDGDNKPVEVANMTTRFGVPPNGWVPPELV